jgi:hypothetical protein
MPEREPAPSVPTVVPADEAAVVGAEGMFRGPELPLNAEHVLALQRTAGNQAVSRMLARKPDVTYLDAGTRDELIAMWQDRIAQVANSKRSADKRAKLSAEYRGYIKNLQTGARPDPYQTQVEMTFLHGSIGAKGETAYKDGRRDKRTKGSTAPDAVHSSALLEFKNYRLNRKGEGALVREVTRQVSARREHGPYDIRQQAVIIDARGQKLKPGQAAALRVRLAAASGLAPENIEIVAWEPAAAKSAGTSAAPKANAPVKPASPAPATRGPMGPPAPKGSGATPPAPARGPMGPPAPKGSAATPPAPTTPKRPTTVPKDVGKGAAGSARGAASQAARDAAASGVVELLDSIIQDEVIDPVNEKLFARHLERSQPEIDAKLDAMQARIAAMTAPVYANVTVEALYQSTEGFTFFVALTSVDVKVSGKDINAVRPLRDDILEEMWEGFIGRTELLVTYSYELPASAEADGGGRTSQTRQ